MVEIRHKGGWTTVYYHLRHIRFVDGDWVPRGAMLGWTSTRQAAAGFASGPHLHFSVKWKGDFINLGGNAIGGWTVREGDVPYAGCLVTSGRAAVCTARAVGQLGLDRGGPVGQKVRLWIILSGLHGGFTLFGRL